jgi:hypothetical protein
MTRASVYHPTILCVNGGYIRWRKNITKATLTSAVSTNWTFTRPLIYAVAEEGDGYFE